MKEELESSTRVRLRIELRSSSHPEEPQLDPMHPSVLVHCTLHSIMPRAFVTEKISSSAFFPRNTLLLAYLISAFMLANSQEKIPQKYIIANKLYQNMESICYL